MSHLLAKESPELVKVDDGAVGVVLQLVKVTHTDLDREGKEEKAEHGSQPPEPGQARTRARKPSPQAHSTSPRRYRFRPETLKSLGSV